MEDNASNLDTFNCCIEADIIYDWVSRNSFVEPIVYEGYQGLRGLELDCDKYITENDNSIFSECYLCDCYGRIVKSNKIPIDEQSLQVYLRDIQSPIRSQNSLGETIIIIEGFFKIFLYNSNLEYCISSPQPFKTVESFYLHRPKGSLLSYSIENVECLAEVVCEESPSGERLFKKINVEISFKLDIQIYKNGTIEITCDKH